MGATMEPVAGSGSCPTCMALVAKPMAFSLTKRGRPVRRRDQRTRWDQKNCAPMKARLRSLREGEATQFKQLTGGHTCRQSERDCRCAGTRQILLLGIKTTA